MKTKTPYKVSLLASVLALSFAAAPRAGANGSGIDHGYYWFIYCTGTNNFNCTMDFSRANQWAGNWKFDWTENVNCGLGGKGWDTVGLVRTINYNLGTLSGSWQSGGEYSWNSETETYISDFGYTWSPNSSVGTVNSDGGTYTVKTRMLSDTFRQMMNARTSAQSKGANHSINKANHVSKWNEQGWDTSKMGRPTWATEALSGPGTADCTIW
jgi:endo-1,4-beta-xylanase